MNKHLLKNNKRLLALFLALIVGLQLAYAQEGYIHRSFTVNSNGDKVVFSQGNLQYQASTNIWKFAEHQYDVIGDANSNISSTYSGWIDLFGWSTSGYNHGANCYQPWSTSQTNSDYYAYGCDTYNLYDQTGQADWGINPISNGGNQMNQWRTLTQPEWAYVFNTRSTASGIRYAKANVNNVNGVILLPDDWSCSIYSLSNINAEGAKFSSNTITAAQWATLENAGAVFLPAAGHRSGTSVYDVGSYGFYWSASYFNSYNAYYVNFNDSYLYTNFSSRYCGQSVRLVRVAENYSFNINTTPNPAEGGAVSGGGTCLGGADCTLTATPAAGYTFVYWTENGMIVSTEATYSFAVVGDYNLLANFIQEEGNIVFTDANVKAICVANWDTNNDGELSYAEAAVVTNLGNVFKNNTTIQSFNELQYFISLTAIDERAFMGCTALVEITIPEHIITIGDKAFVNCPALATVHFNAINCTSMNTVYSGENYSVFMSNQTTFPLANLTIGSNVKNIPDYAFRGCNQIQNLTIPSSVITVGDHAFRGCNQIQNLTIPASVTMVGDYAFYECTNLASLTIGGGAIGEYAFFGCSNLETLTIGEGVTSIDNYAFWNCPALNTVHFNATNCTSMGEVRDEGWEEGMHWVPYWVFYSVFKSGISNDSTSPISTLTIGDNVTRIPACAFCGCAGLSGSLNIPNSVTSIGAYAFINCTGFTGNLTLGNSITEIGAGAFMGCGFIGDLVIPNSVISIHGEDAFFPVNDYSPEVNHLYYGAFMNCGGFTGLTLGNSLTGIGFGAFSGCSGLTGSLIVPNSVVSISDRAFFNCSGFTGSLTIPNSVTIIGKEAFYACSGFTGNLTLGNSLTGIEECAFANCTGFTGNLVIPNSLRFIGYSAFYGCGNFNGELIIGRNVNTIYDEAFSGCCGITALVLETSAKPISEPSYYWGQNMLENYSYFSGLFYGMNRNIPVYVPLGQISDYQNDEQGQWSYFTNYVNQVKFEPDSNNQWSDDFNWSNWEVPTSEDVVCIADNCQLDMDANVLFLYVLDDGDVLTVNSGKTLTSTYGVDTQSPSQLVIADGGQLIANNPVQGTVQKHIDAFTSADDGWNFIASPVMESLAPGTVSGLIPTGSTVYDLYYLDEENTMWRNYKQNAFELNHGQGYLYANGAGSTINFSGNLQPYVEAGVPIALSNEGDGWNLVGNPFTFNAYVNKPYYVINGRTVEAATSGAIAPCTGIVVKATSDNDTVAFTKNNPATLAPNHGNLNIVVAEQMSTRGGAFTSAMLDKAIVSFNAEDVLEKFYFGESKAVVYISRGNEEFAIASSEAQGEMPVNFKARENGNYTITVNSENVELNYLHLIDNLTGTDIDLLATPSYTFIARNDDYSSRFRLVFSAQPNGEENENEDFAFVNNGNIIVNGTGTLQILDVNGRMVSCNSVGDNISTNGLSAGVYMLRLVNPDKVKVQKIVIK